MAAATALAGPVYYYDTAAGSKKLPAYYNGTLFMYEWASNWIKEVKLDEDGNILKINPFLDSMEFIRPHFHAVRPRWLAVRVGVGQRLLGRQRRRPRGAD